ncbi:MAG: hypothetical protein VX527_08580 [Planctomycetota bacterium]|nr:hypothetical protein [Planctomycetota bacterium]
MIRYHTLFASCLLMLLGSLAAAVAPIPQQAQTLLRERDHLQQQLLRADQAAVDAMLHGEDPVELYADQTGLQEQVDILQMRLESLAMRFDFDIPSLSSSIETVNLNAELEPHIAIGRQRANIAMENRCQSACDSIVRKMDFNTFLDF